MSKMTPAQVRSWHKQVIRDYQGQFEAYGLYAEVVKAVLRHGCRRHAPQALVGARAKTVTSFAEKALRKYYEEGMIDPLAELTDLCGGRAIATSQRDVDVLRRFVKGRFAVSQEEDIASRLSPAEFGYRSLHFLVRIEEKTLAGVALPEGLPGKQEILDTIGERVAEIQLRTVLQHGWADVTHDRLYKTTLDVPERIVRSVNRLAAVLEDVDQQIVQLAGDVDAYVERYDAHMTAEQLSNEQDMLTVILANEPVKKNKPAVALRLARIARARRDWKTVISVLGRHEGGPGERGAAIDVEYANALCRRHGSTSPEHGRGLRLLDAVGEADVRDSLRARALAHAASFRQRSNGKRARIRTGYRRANALDPDNPYHLIGMLSCEARESRDFGFRGTLRPQILAAIATCRDHVERGLDAPKAYLAEARLQLFLDREHPALAALAAASMCSSGGARLAGERRHIEKLRGWLKKPYPRVLDWMLRQLLLCEVAKGGDRKRLKRLCQLDEIGGPVLIVAGGAATGTAPYAQGEDNPLRGALAGYEGTVISGGTDVGVAGLVADVAREGLFPPETRIIGYIPGQMPPDCKPDEAYRPLVQTTGVGFSAVEPLQYWTDLLAAGHDASDVRMVGIRGGEIAAYEYRLALALGARVALLAHDQPSAAAFVPRGSVLPPDRLICLPDDPSAQRMFVFPPTSSLTAKQIETAARLVHAQYVEDNVLDSADPSFAPWEHTPEPYQESNRQQVRDCESILAAFGYKVIAGSERDPLVRFKKKEVDGMAEMEHARWLLERLSDGWVWAEEKDKPRKRSPSLVSWAELPESVRDYDRRAVRAWPRILRAAGLRVVRMEG